MGVECRDSIANEAEPPPLTPLEEGNCLTTVSQPQFKKRYKISTRQSAVLEMRQPPGCVRGNAEIFMEVHLVFSCLQHATPLSLQGTKSSLFKKCVSLEMRINCRAFGVAQVVKNLPANTGDPGSIPGSRRSPGEGHANPLQYSCLENPMDTGAWRATVHGVYKVRQLINGVARVRHDLLFQHILTR